MAAKLAKNIKMKDNTLEHLFDFAPKDEIIRLTENNLLKQRNTKTSMNWLLFLTWKHYQCFKVLKPKTDSPF